MTGLRLLATVHGHIGALAAIALLHPAILLRRGRPLTRGLRWAIALATALTATAFATGLVLYGPYREVVRRPLFAVHPAAGLLFETKEHAAFFVLALAAGAGVCALAAPPGAPHLRRAAAAAYGAAAAVALLVAAAGSVVAAHRGF